MAKWVFTDNSSRYPISAVCSFDSIFFQSSSPKFLGEDHVSYCATVPGPGILRNVIFSGYVTFYVRLLRWETDLCCNN